jgi:hypothetical protein
MPRVNFSGLIDFWDLQMQKAFMDAIQNVRDLAQIQQIQTALENGDVEAALKAVNLDPANFRPIDQTLTAAYEAGGNATASGFPTLGVPGGLRVVFQFNVRNPAAEAWISQYSSELVTEIVDGQRTMIRNFLTQGLAAGDNPRTTALDLVGRVGANGQRTGGVIGLTDSQSQWVQNYADALAGDNPTDALAYTLRDARFDGTVQTAFENNEPLTVDQIDRMVTSYTNRALRYRAETISRSETMTALHESQQQAMEQAVASGAIDQSQVMFAWRTAEDDRVRDAHVVMDGQTVAMGDFFIDGDGNLLEYPGDFRAPPETTINCRCWREPVVDFFAGIQ